MYSCSEWTVEPTYTIDDTYECVRKCPVEYPYIMDTIGVMKCVKECTINKYTLVYKNDAGTEMECLSNCENSKYGAIYKYYSKCMHKCPDLTKANENNECLFDLQFGNTVNGFVTSGFSKDQINQILDEVVLFLHEKNEPIQGNDFLLEVYSSNSPFPSNEFVSDLDFTKCEEKIRQEQGISLNEEIIIAKFDYINSTSYTNQVEYKAYSNLGTAIDIECCKDITTNIKYPLNNYDNSIDIDSIKEFASKGMDILDPSSSFYNDICVPYGVNDTDVIIEDRRKYIYKNFSFCEEGCIYQEIDFENRKINCNCSTKITFNENDVYKREPNFKNKTFSQQNTYDTNFVLLKCSHLFSDWNYLKNSASFWAFSSFGCVSLASFVFGFLKEMVSLYMKINSFIMGNPPPHKGNSSNTNNESDDDDSTDKKRTIHKKETALSGSEIRLRNISNEEESSGRKGYLEKYLNQPDEFQRAVVKEAMKRTKLPNENNNSKQSQNDSDDSEEYEEEESNNEKHDKSDSIVFELNYKKPSKDNEYSIPELISDKHYNKTDEIITYIENQTPKEKNKKSKNNYNSKQETFTLDNELNLIEGQYPLLPNIRQDNYPLILAFKSDSRGFCTLYFHFLKKKIPLLRVFNRESKFELISLNFSLYILYICFLLIINTAIYTSTLISDRFKSKGKIDFHKQTLHAFITNIITFFIMKCIIQVSGVRKIFETIFIEVKDSKGLRQITKKALGKVRCRIISFYIGMMIVIAFGCYYVGLFNIVYKYSQLVWIYSTLISMGINVLFMIVISFVVAVLRKIGIMKYSKSVYNLSLLIDRFIW